MWSLNLKITQNKGLECLDSRKPTRHEQDLSVREERKSYFCNIFMIALHVLK